jgi:HKD family nuclease
MRATIHCQIPEEIRNKPADNKAIVDVVRSLFSDNPFSVDILVGYASVSGFEAILDPLKAHVQNGNSFRIVVGCDYGSKHEQVFRLMQKVKFDYPDKIGLKVFTHAGNPSETFHDKLYIFRFQAEVVVLVGSSNLTKGGLLENHELLVSLRYNVSDKRDKRQLEDFERIFKYYWDRAVSLSPNGHNTRNGGDGNGRHIHGHNGNFGGQRR